MFPCAYFLTYSVLWCNNLAFIVVKINNKHAQIIFVDKDINSQLHIFTVRKL